MDGYNVTIEAEEGIGGRAHFLLHLKMVIQRHLLHSCHQTLVRIHCHDHQSVQTN